MSHRTATYKRTPREPRRSSGCVVYPRRPNREYQAEARKLRKAKREERRRAELAEVVYERLVRKFRGFVRPGGPLPPDIEEFCESVRKADTATLLSIADFIERVAPQPLNTKPGRRWLERLIARLWY